MLRMILPTLTVLLFSPAALASLSIDRAILVFETGQSPRQDVIASNEGDTNLFLEVEVLEVTQPGTEQEQRTVIRDPEAIGFVAAPRRLMVPPGGRRPIRLMNLNDHSETERVYRVNVKPVLPPAETEGMGVRIVIAYQVLVFIEPKRSIVKFESRRDGRQLFLKNAGNVNIMLSNGKQCDAPDNRNCAEVAPRRLYPGNDLVIELPRDAPVEFDVEADGQRSTERF